MSINLQPTKPTVIETYGLDKNDIKRAKAKIDKQKLFLQKHYIRVGTKDIYLCEFTKNAYINSDRYIAEVNHRVWSLYNYANNNNLKNIFLTITLPSEYHPKIKNRYKNPKFIDDNEHTPKAGARELSAMYKRLVDLRAYRDIDKQDKWSVKSTDGLRTSHYEHQVAIVNGKAEILTKI